MTTRAGEGEAEKHRPKCLHAIGHIFHDPFIRDRAAFRIDAVIAVEAGGHLCKKVSLRQEITCHLLGNKPIKGHVVIKRLDQPIAPDPHIAQPIVLVAISVGITRGLHPIQGHVLAIAW